MCLQPKHVLQCAVWVVQGTAVGEMMSVFIRRSERREVIKVMQLDVFTDVRVLLQPSNLFLSLDENLAARRDEPAKNAFCEAKRNVSVRPANVMVILDDPAVLRGVVSEPMRCLEEVVLRERVVGRGDRQFLHDEALGGRAISLHVDDQSCEVVMRSCDEFSFVVRWRCMLRLQHLELCDQPIRFLRQRFGCCCVGCC